MTEPFCWPENRACAVSLTYDDALPVHYEYVGPALRARGLLGTFYVHVGGDPLKNPAQWTGLARQGHELGNHTLFHPCRRERPDMYPWLDGGFDLRDYTPYRFQMELRVGNAFLRLLDGKETRTYGCTCSDISIGHGDSKTPIGDLLHDDFVAARGRQTDVPAVVSRTLDLMNIGHCRADFRSFDELRHEILAAKQGGGWLVYHIHGIGADTKELYIEPDVHERLIDFLAAETDVWTQPFITVANRIREWRGASGGLRGDAR